MTKNPLSEEATKMVIADPLCYLRERLLILREGKDAKQLQTLWDAINLFLESAYQSHDRSVASMLEAMGDSIRDSLMGVNGKAKYQPSKLLELWTTKRALSESQQRGQSARTLNQPTGSFTYNATAHSPR